MNDEQTQIQQTFERWVAAICARDIDGVTAAHTDDLVMFDVQPPHDGIRGPADYRDSWPPFFEFISSGAKFEVVELDVCAGEDVAFLYALLRCGLPEYLAEKPDVRLRITMGLRKVDGRWLIAHEHHSFPTEH